MQHLCLEKKQLTTFILGDVALLLLWPRPTFALAEEVGLFAHPHATWVLGEIALLFLFLYATVACGVEALPVGSDFTAGDLPAVPLSNKPFLEKTEIIFFEDTFCEDHVCFWWRLRRAHCWSQLPWLKVAPTIRWCFSDSSIMLSLWWCIWCLGSMFDLRNWWVGHHCIHEKRVQRSQKIL